MSKSDIRNGTPTYNSLYLLGKYHDATGARFKTEFDTGKCVKVGVENFISEELRKFLVKGAPTFEMETPNMWFYPSDFSKGLLEALLDYCTRFASGSKNLYRWIPMYQELLFNLEDNNKPSKRKANKTSLEEAVESRIDRTRRSIRALSRNVVNEPPAVPTSWRLTGGLTVGVPPSRRIRFDGEGLIAAQTESSPTPVIWYDTALERIQNEEVENQIRHEQENGGTEENW